MFRSLQRCGLVSASSKPCKTAKLLFANTDQRIAQHPELTDFKLYGDKSRNRFYCLRPGRLLEFELPRQLLEVTFQFDLSFSKVQLYEAMYKNTEAFRQQFVRTLAKHSEPMRLANSTFRREMSLLLARLLGQAGSGCSEASQICVDFDQVIDEELWRCFEQGLTAQAVCECWLQEVHNCLTMLLFVRLSRACHRRVVRELKKAWHALLAAGGSACSVTRLSDMLLELADRDQARRLLDVMPHLYGELVRCAIITGEQETEQLQNVLDNASGDLKKLYKKDILRPLRLSIQKQTQIKTERSDFAETKTKTQEKKNTSAGLREYYLGRLDKAILLWTRDIVGKHSWAQLTNNVASANR